MKSKKKMTFKEWLHKNKTGYLFLLPFLLLFILFIVVPVGVSMGTSFTNYNMIQSPNFVGFDNYKQLILEDDVFIKALTNTMVFALVTGPIGYFASFFMANILIYLVSCNVPYYLALFTSVGCIVMHHYILF